jgi:peptidyl-prolyl cis-trans isomerase C
MNPKNLILLIILSFSLAGCQQESGDLIHSDDVILVEVDGRPISLPMLEFMMVQRGIAEDDHEAMRELLDELIRLRAVANAAEREGLAEEPGVRAQRALRDMETLQLQYFTRVHEQYPVTDQAIRETYRNQLERSGERQFQLQTIVYPSQADALLQLAALQDGQAGFDDLLEAARSEGRLVEPTGWVDPSQLGAELGPLLEDAATGDVLSAPLRTPQGWRLLRIESTRSLEPPPLEEVRDGIERQLVRQRLEALVEDLYQAAEVTPMLPLEDATE